MTTTYETEPFTRQDADSANRLLEPLSAQERIKWAKDKFQGGLYMLLSFGADSAVTPRLVEQAGEHVPGLTIDTGFRFDETHDFQEHLAGRFGLDDLHIYGPDEHAVRDILDTRLWETDIDAYHEITKLEPMGRAKKELGATAVLSGVRAHQTDNRANLGYISESSGGEFRIHPIIDWTEEQVARFIEDEDLPRHPLYYQGYGSIGDWTITRPGKGRSGRGLGQGSECGLHLNLYGKEPAEA
jgi:phosphoadenosine phosphosulfate reductase